MDMFFATLTLSFTPQIISAIFGGLLGAMISSDRKRYGWQLSFMFCIAAVAFAGAMGEYLHISRGITSIFWMFVLNIPLGMIVGSTLDVLRIASPPLIEKLVNGIGNSGVNIIVESVLGKIANWFGVDVDDYTGDRINNPKNTVNSYDEENEVKKDIILTDDDSYKNH